MPLAQPLRPTSVVDDELLVAYGAAPTTLAPTAAAGVERHLRHCTRCVQTLRHMMRLHRELEKATPEAVTPVVAPEPVHAESSSPAARFARMAAQWREGLRALFTPAMWPRAALAAVGVLVLAIGVSRFVAPAGTNEPGRVRDVERVAMVEVSVDTAGYARPGVR